MSKLTDKIEHLIAWAGPEANAADALQSILADVRELEKERDTAWLRHNDAQEARRIMALCLQGAIDALDTEKE